jgi:hypothetical protein
MRVRVYVDGAMCDGAAEYDQTPVYAAYLFAICREPEAAKFIVEPVDDEARALPGWRMDEDGQFRAFDASPTVSWSVTEVTS